MQLYVKPNSNCEGLSLQTFQVLGPIWTGDRLLLPFGDPPGKRRYLVGWSDLFNGRPCPVNVARVSCGGDDLTGVLVWGGNWGIRLPALGYGLPIVWVSDPGDLPAKVRAAIEA